MKKLYFFLGTLIASIFFFSCSNFDKQASLSFVIPTNFSRAITDGEADKWKVKVSLIGEINQNKEISFSENDFEKEVVFENLEVGKTVTVDVNIFNGETRCYKTENPKSIKLVNGDNFVNIKLIPEQIIEIHENAVYSSFQREDSGETVKKVSYVTSYKNQNASSTDILDNTNMIMYCLDENSNLYLINDKKQLYKYSIPTNGTAEILMNFSNTITTEIKDITYDVISKYFYILALDGQTATAYAFSATEKNVIYTVEIPSASDNNSYIFNQIAVYENNVYVSTEDNIFKMSFTVGGQTVTSETPGKIYSVSDKFTGDFPKITDLQIGDGCGNHTESLYALIRDVGINDNTKSYYSRGGLVSISTSDNSSKENGFSDEKFGEFTVTVGDAQNEFTLYAPRATSITELFGPTRFVAVVPKKLVFFDNGFVFASNDESEKIPVTNKNSFMEFDIQKATLTRYSANITSDVEEISFSSSYFSTN